MAGAEGTGERPGRARSHVAIPSWGKESGFILFLKNVYLAAVGLVAACGIFGFGT